MALSLAIPVVAAVLGWFALRKGSGGKTPEQLPPGGDGGFQSFAPGANGKAWYAATSIAWTSTGAIPDSAGRVALTYQGVLGSADSDEQRTSNDTWLRGAMADKNLRIAVSDQIVIPAQGAKPHMVMAPPSFGAGALPAAWGPLLQVDPPAPGWMQGGNAGYQGQPPAGQPTPGGLTPEQASPYAEITDPEIRAKVQALAADNNAGLKTLLDMATELDKAGYPKAAAALRAREKALAISRKLDAQSAGGWAWTVETGNLPGDVARWYSGNKAGALTALAKLNAAVSANNWHGWTDGTEVLLPGEWPDPSLKSRPPKTGGGGTSPGASGGGKLGSGAGGSVIGGAVGVGNQPQPSGQIGQSAGGSVNAGGGGIIASLGNALAANTPEIDNNGPNLKVS